MTKSRGLCIAAVAVTALLGALYFFFDPSLSRWAPKCYFYAITGWECPGCGSQRMLHALLHGDLAGAWRYNAFLLCMLPALALMLFTAATRLRLPKLYAVINSVPVILTVACSMLAWGVVRNFI